MSTRAARSLGADVAPGSRADPELFRAAVSRFATGVVVLGCRDGDGAPYGMTVNSFTSVSLEPPTVLVSLKRGRMHGLVAEAGAFGASVLGASHEALSRHFAGRPSAAVAPDFIDREGVPLLACAIAWFVCRVTRAVDLADHTLFVAEVAACEYRDAPPLVFQASRYRHGLGDALADDRWSL